MTLPDITRPPVILGISARTETALAHTASGLADFLERSPLRRRGSLRDVAHTLVHGREQFAHRRAVVADDLSSAATALRAPAGTGVAQTQPVRTVFAFTGQGGQYSGMAAGAYTRYPEFRDWIDRAHTLLEPVLAEPLKEALFNPGRAARLARTDIAAPALLAVQFGLVRVLARYGIRPDAVLGHSVGEFGAAALAGAVSSEEALLLVAERGRLMVAKCSPGAMMSVSLRPGTTWDQDALTALVAEEPLVAVAAYNSPRHLVLSGNEARLEQIEERLGRDGAHTRRLPVSHAFHSPLLEPMAEAFQASAAGLTWSAPGTTSWFSCAGGWMHSAPDATHWLEHLAQPVQFWDALTEVCAGSASTVLIEIGAHPTLLPLAGHLPAPPVLVPTLERERDAATALASAAAQAWCAGVPTDLTGGEPGRRIHLPGYGFDRRVHAAKPRVPDTTVLPTTVASATPVASPTVDALNTARPSAHDLLAGIWLDLLGVAPDEDSSFIQAGGDSLTLLRLRQRLQADRGTAPGVGELLDAGTFAAMRDLLPDVGTPQPDPVAVPATSAPTSAPTVATYRPSWAQQRMLFVDLVQPGSNQHNVTLAVDLADRVDAEAMRGAFTDAQRRHSALRTRFRQRDGGFEAEIQPEPGAQFSVMEAPLDDADVQRWVGELSAAPQPCVGQLPVRATLVLAPQRSLLVVTVHHAVTDATSMSVMIEEMAADYRRRQAGDTTSAPTNVHQFHDVLVQLEQAEGDALAGSGAYWRQQLEGAPDLVPLPTDRPRPLVRDGAGSTWGMDLDPALTAGIRALSAELGVTPFSTLMAAYAVLLRHHSGAEDMTIATPVSHRPTEASQRVFGLMLNTLVLRVRPRTDESFAALVREVGATVLEGIAHSAFPFDRLVADRRAKRDTGRTPLFSVMFAMPGDVPLPAFDGVAARSVRLPGIGAKFDLTMYLVPTAQGGLHLDLEYDPALFDEARIEAWGADYGRLLEAAVSDPGARPAVSRPTEAATLSELEEYVARLWSQTLQVDVSDPQTDFFEAGGHSLQVLGCLVTIQERFPETTIQDFFSYPTVERFAARLAEMSGAAAAPAAPSNGEVLLTGVTGFLGVHLLAALLQEPERRVACIVRPGADLSPMQRLEHVVRHYVPDLLDELPRRVRIIEADLSTLTAEELGRQTGNVEEVFHAAAEVRHYGDAEHYAATNVQPTAMLAELARARGWRMAHMSTLAAVGPAPDDGTLITLRENDFDRGEVFDSPYARSKFEAELVVRKAIADGLDATVHRVGSLVGSTRTGVFLPDPSVNILYQILRVVVSCGLVPDAPGWGLDLTPVDFAAEAIVRLARDRQNSGGTFHVCNPRNLPSGGLVSILRELGYPIVPASPQAVGAWLARPEADAIDADAFAFLAQFVKPVPTLVQYDAYDTTAALGDLRCPPPDAALMRTLLGHGIATGFFPRSRLWDFVTRPRTSHQPGETS